MLEDIRVGTFDLCVCAAINIKERICMFRNHTQRKLILRPCFLDLLPQNQYVAHSRMKAKANFICLKFHRQ